MSGGVPLGIQTEIISATEQFASRYWIVDNSGSMTTGDGHMFKHAGGREGMVQCSRWKELVQTLEWVGEIAIGLDAPTQFLLLNPANGVSKINLGHGKQKSERADLRTMTTSSPTGCTPLCARIREVVAAVKAQASMLRSNGQRAVVTIATDGMSSDGDVAAALKPLEKLPVWVVIKLCTDDDAVVDYWNNIDGDLELDMDVLDDLVGEAQEVVAVNPWLTYAPALHRLREWGSPHKLLDMLDEVEFSLDQAQQMMELILGTDALDSLQSMPLFSAQDMPAFMAELQRIQDSQGAVWDPIASRRAPWFNAQKLPGVQSMPSAPEDPAYHCARQTGTSQSQSQHLSLQGKLPMAEPVAQP